MILIHLDLADTLRTHSCTVVPFSTVILSSRVQNLSQVSFACSSLPDRPQTTRAITSMLLTSLKATYRCLSEPHQKQIRATINEYSTIVHCAPCIFLGSDRIYVSNEMTLEMNLFLLTQLQSPLGRSYDAGAYSEACILQHNAFYAQPASGAG